MSVSGFTVHMCLCECYGDDACIQVAQQHLSMYSIVFV